MTFIAWSEPACLVRTSRDARGGTDREIVAEGSFAEIAVAFGRFRTSEWANLMIAFPERRRAPFRYEQADFCEHVLGRLLIGGFAAPSPPAPTLVVRA